MIAEAEEGIFFETTPGTMVDVTMDLADKIVTRSSAMTILFSPLHRAMKADSMLKIEVQRDMGISCPDPGADKLFALNSDVFSQNFKSVCKASDDGVYEYI